MLTIGKKIKLIRENNKLSQKDFSKKLNISIPYLSSLENNKKEVTSKVIQKIYHEFNISTDWLLFSNSEKIIKNNNQIDNSNDNLNDNPNDNLNDNLMENDFENYARNIFNNREKLNEILSEVTDVNKLNSLLSESMSMENFIYYYFDKVFLGMLKELSYDSSYKKDKRKLINEYKNEINDFNNLIKVYYPVYKALKESNDYFKENYDRLKLYGPDF